MIYRFGPFELDGHESELRRQGRPVGIAPKPLVLLLLLVENSGKLINKYEIQQRVWPDVHVGESNLTRTVHQLRKLLGKRPHGAEYIETVPKRGYRFAAEVERRAQEAPPPAITAALPRVSPPPAETRRARFGWAMLAGAGIALVLGTLLAWAWARPGRAPAPATDALLGPPRPATTNSDLLPVRAARLAPAGDRLAYSDGSGLFVRNLANGLVRRLPVGGMHLDPCGWERGETLLLACGGSSSAPPALWTIALDGAGQPRELRPDVSRAAVSPTGDRIAFLGADGRGSVWVMRSDGGGAREIYAVPPLPQAAKLGWGAAGALSDLNWFPGGRRLAVLRHGPDQSATLVVIRAADGAAVPWLAQPGLTGELPLAAGAALVSAVGPDRRASLWLLAGAPGTPAKPRLIRDSYGAAMHDWSGDRARTRFVYLAVQSNPYVAVGTLRDGGRKLGDVRRLTLDNSDDYPHAWTRDSRQVLFESDREGRFGIFAQNPDRPDARLLAGGGPGPAETQPRLAPSGPWLLSAGIATPRGTEIYLTAAAGGASRALALVPDFAGFRCARVASGRCLAAERDGRGPLRFFILDPQRGLGAMVARIPLPIGPEDWDLAPDGQHIAAISGADNRIRELDLADGRRSVFAFSAWRKLRTLDFSADGRSWFGAGEAGARRCLLRLGRDGTSDCLLVLPAAGALPWAVPSPDGRRLAWPSFGETAQAYVIQRIDGR